MARMMLAHQGGWDEVLFALTPLVVVAILLLVANKRANAAKAAADLANAGDQASTKPNPSDESDQQ